MSVSERDLLFDGKIDAKLTNERDVREHFLNRAHRLGLLLVEGQEAYPDLHMRDVESSEDVYVEVEHLSANFIAHGHHKQEVENDADILICGADNLSDEGRKKTPEVISLEERFGAEIDYVPHYRLVPYEATSTRRKSIALRVTESGVEARLEDETRTEGEDASAWTDDSTGTMWMPVEEFCTLFHKLSEQMVNGETIGDLVFSPGSVDFQPLIELGQSSDPPLQDQGDSAALVEHDYRHPRKEKQYIARASIKRSPDSDAIYFRIGHWADGGSSFTSQRATVFNPTEFSGVFDKLPDNVLRSAIVSGDEEKLIKYAERVHGAALGLGRDD
ncbi:hypothetical protein [Halalkalirubrum salinum]|uniref:hypothetical protein n=1 Tax=Halalkalirubrum salinum TaxID=2563889 RepID=UPI0010FB367E|nr:hypothetical protein [Halalkalirubrum salinum]